MVKLQDLINRGDVISIISGKLNIIPSSGKMVPEKWLQDNSNYLLEQISEVTQQPIYQFTQFKVGRYLSRYDGLTMSFIDLKLREDYYTIFNVSLNRKKKHGRLAGKLFNPPAQGLLLRFWSRSNLPKPRRPSELYKKINVMKSYFWQAELNKKNKLETQSLRLANITHQQILDAVSGGVSAAHEGQGSGVMVSANSGGLSGQNEEASIGGCELPNNHIYQGVESSLTTCVNNHGHNKLRIPTATEFNNHDISKQDSAVLSNAIPPSIEQYKGGHTRRPQDQTIEEWWAGYDTYK
ncbi:hypothetical protein B5G52_16570 [Pseudoalteromonas sp. A601]|uniref:hypothetical protein n=1 Tax=Pseudoalteromonas sp. A601 TaxID=1967839 RepID=UPI000B3CF595|nr:hypothetical protein [Pseudoalteromonas sp. A601]OUS69511.1 hypothetical protein B5G52_16570 [Pseudoalteromonas sp. A601]